MGQRAMERRIARLTSMFADRGAATATEGNDTRRGSPARLDAIKAGPLSYIHWSVTTPDCCCCSRIGPAGPIRAGQCLWLPLDQGTVGLAIDRHSPAGQVCPASPAPPRRLVPHQSRVRPTRHHGRRHRRVLGWRFLRPGDLHTPSGSAAKTRHRQRGRPDGDLRCRPAGPSPTSHRSRLRSRHAAGRSVATGSYRPLSAYGGHRSPHRWCLDRSSPLPATPPGARRATGPASGRSPWTSRSVPQPTAAHASAGPTSLRSSSTTPTPASAPDQPHPRGGGPARPDGSWPRQLRCGHTDQQLPRRLTAIPLLDRPHRAIQRPDHIQLLTRLGHRRHPDSPVIDGSGAPIRTLGSGRFSHA